MPESNIRTNNLRDRLLQIDLVNHTETDCDVDQLEQAARAVLKQFGVAQANWSIAIVDDPTIRDLNQQYLQHDYETDVLSFPLSEPGAEIAEGDIIVSIDTAARIAAECGSSVAQELLLYVIHGSLHLVGLRDETDEQSEEMRHWENLFLRQFGYEPVLVADDEPPVDFKEPDSESV